MKFIILGLLSFTTTMSFADSCKVKSIDFNLGIHESDQAMLQNKAEQALIQKGYDLSELGVKKSTKEEFLSFEFVKSVEKVKPLVGGYASMTSPLQDIKFTYRSLTVGKLDHVSIIGKLALRTGDLRSSKELRTKTWHSEVASYGVINNRNDAYFPVSKNINTAFELNVENMDRVLENYLSKIPSCK